MSRPALISPTTSRARRAAKALRADHGDLVPFSWKGFLAARSEDLSVVLDPAGDSVGDAIAFLRRAQRRILWPPPSARIGAAIAGLRDEPIASEGGTRRRGRESAFLLEGNVTLSRALRALDRPAASRDWVVEDVRRVRLDDEELARVARRGVRWFVLAPVQVVAVVADDALERAGGAWRRLVPRGTPIWKLPG